MRLLGGPSRDARRKPNSVNSLNGFNNEAFATYIVTCIKSPRTEGKRESRTVTSCQIKR